MSSILKKLIGIILSTSLIFSNLIQIPVSVHAEENIGSEYYLSDLEWASASHGDWDESKTVQKIIRLHWEIMGKIQK